MGGRRNNHDRMGEFCMYRILGKIELLSGLITHGPARICRQFMESSSKRHGKGPGRDEYNQDNHRLESGVVKDGIENHEGVTRKRVADTPMNRRSARGDHVVRFYKEKIKTREGGKSAVVKQSVNTG